MFDVGKLEGPFEIGAAPVPPKGVGIMVGTDLAGGNDRCALSVLLEGTVTVGSGMVTVISGTVTVDVRPDSVDRTVDESDGTSVEDSGVMLDIEDRVLTENGGC